MENLSKLFIVLFLFVSFSCADENHEGIQEEFANPFELVGQQHNDGLTLSPLGKVNILVSKPAISTISAHLSLKKDRLLDFSMMCYLIRPNSLCI